MIIYYMWTVAFINQSKTEIKFVQAGLFRHLQNSSLNTPLALYRIVKTFEALQIEEHKSLRAVKEMLRQILLW